MGGQTKTLEELIREVPPEYQSQLRNYVESLLAKPRAGQSPKLTFRWAGALKDLRERYTSVELQHEIEHWRIGGE